jgi:hypothetical protein
MTTLEIKESISEYPITQSSIEGIKTLLEGIVENVTLEGVHIQFNRIGDTKVMVWNGTELNFLSI